ncbi:MAG: glycosyltransferase family 39 protein [Pseudomonadota bacterium]
MADRWTALVLALLVVPTRFSVAGEYLTTWDAVQYALAVEHFDVGLHQPHPPGYILLVGLLRVANLALADARLSMLAVNTLFGATAVGLTYLLGASLFGRVAALTASLLLLSSPIMWYCGATYEPYVALAGISALVAYFCYQAVSGNRRFMAAATASLALGGGVRPDSALFLFPLWLLSLVYAASRMPQGRMRFLGGQVSLLVLLTLSWYLPLLYLTGGYHAYGLLNQSQLNHCFEAKSVFFGGPWREHVLMAVRHGLNATLAAGPVAALLLLLGLPWLSRDRGAGRLARAFCLTWILPSVAFYTLAFFSKSGYTLIYAPPLALLAGRGLQLLTAAVARRTNGRLAEAVGGLVLAAALGLNVFLFLGRPPALEPTPKGSPAVRRLGQMARAEAASVNRAAIVGEDRTVGTFVTALRRVNPATAAIICRGASPDWRRLMYYLRNHDVYWLVDNRLMERTPNGTEFWLAHGGKVVSSSTGAGFWLPGRSFRQLPVPLAAGVQELFILAKEDDPLLRSLSSALTPYDLGGGRHLALLRLKSEARLTADRFTFIRPLPQTAEPAPRIPASLARDSGLQPACPPVSRRAS